MPKPEIDNGTMADRLRDTQRNAAQVAEIALEEIRRDGAFDYDPNFEYIIEDDTNGFNENDDPVYEQQQQPQRPLRLQNSVAEVLLGEIFKEPPQYMKDILLDPITSKYSRTISAGDPRGETYSMTINGRLFHRFDGIIAQENGQEKLEEINTLYSDFATNGHVELLRGVLQNDEE
ncbi:hypothetical protein BN1211_2175 [Cyberlindnera jadinii]|uniref:Uncharacterized protein n=1 Tax=Cyberlindnera jadinii (strain ATCC 18201 / CBS 1600 / BCRC 20928 / JCM 3617 / NBRC 0987 / NRRL Y-1542) TaxID=983966 RepID=A0A0H5C222_CYBJN|nr:hypothetical protein BN1211_2175 [Cyberlindnera jadinii]